mmetsp:Transcript_7417/g.22569  ORF Transcript_7417/g.22569 Transcript_7417/m.22569 type:complete len:239 (+) Transcript_7417:277-993(+)
MIEILGRVGGERRRGEARAEYLKPNRITSQAHRGTVLHPLWADASISPLFLPILPWGSFAISVRWKQPQMWVQTRTVRRQNATTDTDRKEPHTGGLFALLHRQYATGTTRFSRHFLPSRQSRGQNNAPGKLCFLELPCTSFDAWPTVISQDSQIASRVCFVHDDEGAPVWRSSSDSRCKDAVSPPHELPACVSRYPYERRTPGCICRMGSVFPCCARLECGPHRCTSSEIRACTFHRR